MELLVRGMMKQLQGKQMKSKLKFIKMSIWAGIIADLLWAIGLFYPQLFVLLTGRAEFIVDLPVRLIMGIGGSLMLGWTCLLCWTLKKPVERRAVLLLTAFPVVFGIFAVSCISVAHGNSGSLWISMKTLAIFVAMLVSYYLACRIDAGETRVETISKSFA